MVNSFSQISYSPIPVEYDNKAYSLISVDTGLTALMPFQILLIYLVMAGSLSTRIAGIIQCCTQFLMYLLMNIFIGGHEVKQFILILIHWGVL